ncbi:MAG TPA: hypothetical protein H9859_00885 [Candidatus Barnesiella excrementigallinarum]|nr:hypothetical protein [Candidatus Barnesiella excrementigallinarum]
MKTYIYLLAFATATLCVAGCTEENPNDTPKPTPPKLSEEYYTGGELGTAFNTTSSAFEQPSAAVENAGMSNSFKNGEALFEKIFTPASDGSVRGGLGPLYIRTSCMHCHPGYGHGKRQEGTFNATEIGNGYLLVIYDDNDNYIASLTGMPQLFAVEPFKAPIDPSKIKITWKSYTDNWNNTFEDGTTYELIYPEVTIPADAYYVDLITTDGRTLSPDQVNIRLESTIGIYGTGLLDAISDEDLKAEYTKQEQDKHFALNPKIFQNGEWTSQYSNNRPNDGGTGEKHPFRFTYALSRGPLQDAAGSNAIWNITNVTRSNRRYHYMTKAYAEKASKDPEVQTRFYDYFPERKTDAGVEQDIYNYLMATDLPVEMSDEYFTDLMVWHRGLAVPAARNLDDPTIQRGKQLFTEMGCSYCHRPTWTTGDDRYTDPSGFFKNGNELPRYPYQKIWPYSDLVQHRLHMKNDIRTGWCRTTPLWGRGLHQKCTGSFESDRLHDCRARNVIEAIMWHGSPESDARWSIEKFRSLSKEDREAVVKFIDAI